MFDSHQLDLSNHHLNFCKLITLDHFSRRAQVKVLLLHSHHYHVDINIIAGCWPQGIDLSPVIWFWEGLIVAITGADRQEGRQKEARKPDWRDFWQPLNRRCDGLGDLTRNFIGFMDAFLFSIEAQRKMSSLGTIWCACNT